MESKDNATTESEWIWEHRQFHVDSSHESVRSLENSLLRPQSCSGDIKKTVEVDEWQLNNSLQHLAGETSLLYKTKIQSCRLGASRKKTYR